MTRAQWIKEYYQFYNSTADTKKVNASPTWLIELAVRYARLAKSGGMRTETEFKMHNLTAVLDLFGVKQQTDVWQLMVVRDIAEARAAHKKPADDEPAKPILAKRPTASSIIVALLRERPVRSDEQLIAAVNAGTFHDGFNRAQLAWYKGKFKKGELKGQDGPETICEKAPDNHVKVRVNA